MCIRDSPLTAKLIEEIGYVAVYVSGGVMANDLGFPDIGGIVDQQGVFSAWHWEPATLPGKFLGFLHDESFAGRISDRSTETPKCLLHPSDSGSRPIDPGSRK